MNQDNYYSQQDIDQNKVISALAYLLFFLPLLACPGSAYGKFHANQGLLLLIVAAGGNFALSILPFVGGVLLPIFNLIVFAFMVLGIVNALGGNAKPLPLFGQHRILH